MAQEKADYVLIWKDIFNTFSKKRLQNTMCNKILFMFLQNIFLCPKIWKNVRQTINNGISEQGKERERDEVEEVILLTMVCWKFSQ